MDRGKKSARENEEKKGKEKKVKEEKARKKAEKKRTKMKRKQKDNDDEQEKSQEQADASNPSDSTKSLTPSTLSEDLEDIFDISTEIEDRTTVLKEIKDIRHELNILRNLFDQQKIVIESFCQAVETGQKETGILVSNARPSLMDGIKRHIEVVDAMREAAKRPYQAVSLLPIGLQVINRLVARRAFGSEAKASQRIRGSDSPNIGRHYHSFHYRHHYLSLCLFHGIMVTFLALPIAEFPKTSSTFELSYATKYASMTLI